MVMKDHLFFLQDLDLKSLIIEAYFKGQQVYTPSSFLVP